MIAAAPIASTRSAMPLSATPRVIAVTAARMAGAIKPCRTTSFIGSSTGRSSMRHGRGIARTHEPIPGAAHRLDQAVDMERLERDAKTPDVHVDGALLDVDVVAPDHVEQLRAAVHA